MRPNPFYKVMRESKDPIELRYRLVRFASEHGVKPAARAFGTTPKTVRKWLGRWKPDTKKGLASQSRAPKNPARKITPSQRQKAIELKRRLPSFGAERIKRDFSLTISVKAIRRIWRQEGLIRVKRKKHKTKNDLRALKAQWRLFEQVDIDTKHLSDIPEYWPQMQRLGLPRFQYTAREVVSGVQFLGFADECCLQYATLFAQILINHLNLCGLDLAKGRFQTDNGSEFIGSWNAKHDSAFTQTVQAVPGLLHQTIPPGAHTYQADVETAHNLIEDELYQVESFSSKQNFQAKAATYLLWFNVARKNSYKNHKTPWEIIHDRNPNIKPQIATLPPLDLDDLWQKKMTPPSQRGYDVIPYPSLIALVNPLGQLFLLCDLLVSLMWT